jgi:glyoxalase family protein
MTMIQGNHHLTMSVGKAQEDWDFHTKALGLQSVKKTVLFDGTLPIYHLYYANHRTAPTALLTTFPFHKVGIMGRRGSNQIKILDLSVAPGSLDYWANRLDSFGVAHAEAEIFELRRIHFAHPCGIEYALVGDPEVESLTDQQPGGADLPAEHVIRGTHGVTISVHDPAEMGEYIENALGGEKIDEAGAHQRFQIGREHQGRYIELVHEPDVPPGTWKFGEGTVHHVAYNIVDAETQQKAKDLIEGLGYTDVTEMKDRNYFYSCYNRSPSGALVELAWSHPDLFCRDEPPETVGSQFMLPPQFEHRREEIMAGLEPFNTD